MVEQRGTGHAFTLMVPDRIMDHSGYTELSAERVLRRICFAKMFMMFLENLDDCSTDVNVF
jgi:hypothetical protein